MTQYGIFFDQSRCYGCKACSVACKDWYDIAPGPEKWMSVYMWEEGVFPSIRMNILAFNCGHCDDPACMTACVHDAISKDTRTGAVIVDQDKCEGDRNCFTACPYGAPKFASDEPGTKMSKCTMCVDRLEMGELPVCVAACQMRALDFGPIDELVAKYGDCRQLEGMPSPSATVPNWVARPRDEKKELVAFDPEKFIALSQPRADMGDIFTDVENLINPGKDVITRNKLNMKCSTVKEVMENTRSDQG